jgi:hypothetical protein
LVVHAGFAGAEGAEAPLRFGDLTDAVGFEGVAGLKVGEEVCEERVEMLAVVWKVGLAGAAAVRKASCDERRLPAAVFGPVEWVALALELIKWRRDDT